MACGRWGMKNRGQPGFLTTLCRFESGARKGGVLTPPQSGFENSVRLAPRAVRRLTDCAGRETGGQLEASVTAGLKPRPSLFVVRNPG